MNENENRTIQPEENHDAEAALTRREEVLRVRELRLMAGEELLKRGLSNEIMELLDFSDRDKCLASLNRAQQLIDQEAAKLADRRFAARALPGGAATVDSESLSDREYYAMTLKKAR